MLNHWMHAWYRSPGYFLLLAPLAWLFGKIVRIRRLLYHWGIFSSISLPYPIVVVGNLEIGGSGKTPFVIALVHALKKSGLSVGIISRGYGRASTSVVEVKGTMPISDVGDEALLISRATQCPVFVGHCRVSAVQTLSRYYACDVIVSDDGLQHYALDRDLNIALEYVHPDYQNQWMLPVGPYREPRSRFSEMDFHLQHGPHHQDITFSFGRPYCLNSGEDIDWSAIPKENLYVVAGIAKPERFYKMLNEKNLTFKIFSIKDHSTLSSYDLKNIPECAWIIMTEKDAVKYPKRDLIFDQRKVVVIPYRAKINDTVLDQLLASCQDLLQN